MSPQAKHTIRAVIVEDEQRLADLLQALLAMRHPNVEVVGTAGTVSEALELVTRQRPELLFLDIGLREGLQGFSVLEQLGPSAPHVIVTTASAEHAVNAFRFEAVDYLLKPIDTSALDRALERVYTRIRAAASTQHGREFAREWWEVPTASGFIRVHLANIRYAKAEGSYTLLYLADIDKPLTISRPLGDVEIELGPGFLRTHRSYLVNPDHVRGYTRTDGDQLELSNGTKVAIARDRVQEVLRLLKGYAPR